MTIKRLFALCAIGILMIASSVSAQEDETLNIVATTTQAVDIANILTDGVETVNITALMGAGVDPHLYQPTEADISAMNDADIVIYNGLNLEGQFDTVFQALSEQGTSIFALGNPVKDEGFIVGGFELSDELQDVDDPHFWFDPRNWEISVTALAEELAELDPDNADMYTANSEGYLEQLALIFEWADEAMSLIDEEQRFIVTSHDAFQYFGTAFGWQMVAIQGLSTEDEAGVGDIQETVDFILENEIPVIFIESSLPPDTVEAVVEAVQDEGGELRVGVRELYSDAMGEPDTFGGTYVGMIAENVFTILQSYQCAGTDITIPDFPADLDAQPDEDILNVNCDMEMES
ncbi:MAG: zinc ABC transporter substrate-binding protein [Chloroflexota bacterium]